MSFLKTYINYIMQPAKQVSESGSFGSFLPDLHPPAQDDALAVPKSESGKDSFPSFDESGPAGQFNESPVLSSEKRPAVVPSGTGPSSFEIRFSNDSLPEEESGAALWVAPRQLAPGTDDSKPLTETRGPEADQEVRQRTVEIFKTNIVADIPRTDDPGREEKADPAGNPEVRNDSIPASRPAPETFETGESGDAGRNPEPVPETVRPMKLTNKNSGKNPEGNVPQKKTGPVGNPEVRNDSAPASRPAPETFETGESGDAGRNPEPAPETVRPVKLTNKDSGKTPEGNIPQKKTGAIEQQNRVNEGRPRVEASDDRLEKIFPHRAEPVQNNLSKIVPPVREIPQVRIGHINVLVEDRSKANARSGPGKAAAAPPNTFGLKGV